MGECMEKVSIGRQMEKISAFWQPRIAGELNGQHIKLARLKGEFVMHRHESEDEMFLVLKGKLEIKCSDRSIVLEAGEFLIIPRGVDHMPVAVDEVEVMLFEPVGTRNTGNVENERTVTPDRISDV